MDKTTLLTIAICFVAYIIGRVLETFLKSDTASELSLKFNVFIKYADAFVSWAKKFMSDKTGEEKMNAVILQLEIVAKKYGMNMSEEEIKAIAQKAYDAMKAGMKEDANPIEDAQTIINEATVAVPASDDKTPV